MTNHNTETEKTLREYAKYKERIWLAHRDKMEESHMLGCLNAWFFYHFDDINYANELIEFLDECDYEIREKPTPKEGEV